MKVNLIRIGNSRGIRIPKPLIEQCRFTDTADLRIEHDHLVIAPYRKPRQDWERAFRSAGSADEDELLLDAMPSNVFDREEWRW
jgi:antitoxin MazE